MLSETLVQQLARQLYQARKSRVQIRHFSKTYPEMTFEDGYNIQREWVKLEVADGRQIRGRKIGLTSRAMQQSSQINEPDYAPLMDDMFFEAGSDISIERFIVPRVEVELGFILKDPLRGPGVTVADVLRATAYVIPALEIIDARIEQFDRDTKAPRKVFDTISDFAANAGIVTGGLPVKPDSVDLRWIGAMLYKNAVIEETGIAAAVLNHPANGVAWVANKIAPYNEQLNAGDLVLGGSFTRPTSVVRGDVLHADYGPLGSISVRFYLSPPMLLPINQFKHALVERKIQLGLWHGLANAYVSEILAATGFDWICIDAEHSPNDPRVILTQLQVLAAYPVNAVVRTLNDDMALIKQYLDIGAQTLLVPMVETAEQAKCIVAATRYPPHGVRGVGSALARASRWSQIPDYLNRCQAEICVLVQVESLRGVANLSDIAAVDGVDGVFFGPSDLAASMGLLGQSAHTSVQQVVTEGIERVIAARKAAGVLTADVALAKKFIGMGANFVAVGLDTSILVQGAQQLVRQFNT